MDRTKLFGYWCLATGIIIGSKDPLFGLYFVYGNVVICIGALLLSASESDVTK